jgi:hypothetical protein
MLAFQGRLLKRAAEICGGPNALCLRMGVSEHHLRMWLEAKARLPEQMFLKATDIVLEDDIARAEQDRRNQPRIAVLAAAENKPTSSPAA